MRITHNLSALNTTRLLGSTTRKQSQIGEKLSSGYKINRSADNAAGLSISEKMRAQIRGLDQSSRNAQDGISLIETADGALNEIHNIIQRMRELSVQAANGTSTEEDKKMIQSEIGELTEEINRISNDTEFNNIKLLNGNLAQSSINNISLNELLSRESDGLNIIYIDNDYRTEQTTVGSSTSKDAKYDKLKELLKTEIVPEAIDKILKTFSPAFDYLSSSTVGIGLKLESSNGRALASVYASQRWNGDAYYTDYTLTINTKDLFDSSGNITEEKRKELEAIVAHEFVHGVMDEALTCGMVGISNNNVDNSNKFPLWFVEGMAQTASGGYANFNDFVNMGLGIDENSSLSTIASTVKGTYRLSNCESDSTGRSSYGTGYLACMYLGYLANGASDISEESIRTGLSNILKDMIGGKDFNTVIKERTNNKYTSVMDFQNKFGDADSSEFIHQLTIKVGEGNGSLVAENYNTDDILPDTSIPISLFELNTDNDTVRNLYPNDEVTMFSGGGLSVSGSEPVTGYKESVSGSGSGGKVDPPIVDPPVASGNKIDLSNIKAIDGIEYDKSNNTLTITKNGDYTLSGVNSLGTKVVIKDGVQANITLDNAKINTSNGEGIKLGENSNVTLTLTGNNNITSTTVKKAAIGVTGNSVLNIEGDGKLTVQGGEFAAGIGGNELESAGTINIKSGEINATGGSGGAGIGGGIQGTGGNINITGGNVNATGGTDAAGIGGGSLAESGNIKIDGESAVVIAKSGGGGAENIGAGSQASVSTEKVNIGSGVVSDGTNWTAHGKVIIKTTIKISGTFTGGNGTTITIADGGSITGSGTIKIENGSTIKVENGGSITGGSTIDNKGNIDNHGTIQSTFTPDSANTIKNYVNKIINEIDKQFRLNIGETLESSIPTPKIKISCNGVTKTLASSSSAIYDSNGNEITNPSDITLASGDKFTYKVTFKLDENSNEYFDKNGALFDYTENTYTKLGESMNYNQLVNSEVSADGKSITYTYALEAEQPSASGDASSSVDNGKLILQIGANSNQAIGISIDGMGASQLGLNNLSVTNEEDAEKAIDFCDSAINKVSTNRARLGAYQNRLEHTISNLDNANENLQQSESRIRDLDIAQGMAEYSKYQILSQVEQAMLSQANQMSNSVLNLLRV